MLDGKKFDVIISLKAFHHILSFADDPNPRMSRFLHVIIEIVSEAKRTSDYCRLIS